MFKEDYTALNQSIKATDELKAKTLKKVYEKENNKFTFSKPVVLRFAAAAACVVVVFSAAVFWKATFGMKKDSEMLMDNAAPQTNEAADGAKSADSYVCEGAEDCVEEKAVSSFFNVENNPSKGGDGDLLSRKYLNVTYDIYCCNVILGDEAVDKWVNGVYLEKSEAEREASPTLYQAVTELHIERSQIEAYNSDESLNKGLAIPKVILDAIYDMDFDEMKEALTNPFALYYDGEVYTARELSEQNDLPPEVVEEYSSRLQDRLIKEVGQKLYDKDYRVSVDGLKK